MQMTPSTYQMYFWGHLKASRMWVELPVAIREGYQPGRMTATTNNSCSRDSEQPARQHGSNVG